MQSRRDIIKKGLAGIAGITGLNSISRVDASQHSNSHRLLGWNTWLLGVFDMYGVEIATKPEYEKRAVEIGEVLSELDYDVMALMEVFNAAQRKDIVEGMNGQNPRSRHGPESTWFSKSSGLQTIIKGEQSNTKFISTNKMEFSNNGDILCDSDAWSRKGVLHTEIDLGEGNIDLYSTHMFAGGGLPFCIGGGADRFTVREQHVSELTEFVKQTSSPENVSFVTGDFNIAAGREDHSYILDMMDELGLYDLWTRHGERNGPTNGAAFGEGCRIDTDSGYPYYCKGTVETPAEDSKRIDYVFIEEPKNSHEYEVEITDIKRASFWREKGDPMQFSSEGDIPNYLSDHMALDVSFEILN